MATLPPLDVNQKLIELSDEIQREMERNGVPSAYFEELWYLLTQCLADFEDRIATLEGP